ncbi:AAA family ATPase [Fuerstiella marisgermanici]|uniref:Polynucleotide kinase n=1 Tax=Fuerstiella marisgermanici TaxID=1891926 RepID=A0A1P8WH38_9PLAN|nr:AAA family ATPase [Fuerstiella marisgermanici]APZ93363.1 polynucleotide kinase [Fuerstiella marisgermanici]
MNWQTLKQIPLDDILAWAESQPWCRAMADCLQDAEWHSEGDVWTHTKMVCHQLVKLEEWPSLTEQEKTVLIFTALFHDAAKPLTSQTDPDTGRVTSPKHAVKGEHLARSILRDIDCDLMTRKEIARLVRFHGRPAFLLERDDPTHEVVRLSWLVNNRLLYLFALADTRGRDTDSMTRPEENLQYWKLTAEESDCYDQPYPFANDQARFLFYRNTDPNLHYVPHEDFSCTVTMLSGLPGSGKDTWLSRHRDDLPVVSLDEIRNEMKVEPTDNQGEVVQLARERCREHLRAGTSFAFNATNTQKDTRQRWLDLFADYNAAIEIVYVEPQFNLLLKQNKGRSNSVPENVIRKLAAKCEPPTWTEAHTVILTNGESN